MIADTLDELHEMASKIGLKRAWFQDPNGRPHYDLTASRRRLAVSKGAIELEDEPFFETLRRLYGKKKQGV